MDLPNVDSLLKCLRLWETITAASRVHEQTPGIERGAETSNQAAVHGI